MGDAEFSGVLPAAVTPFDDELELDGGGLERNLEFMLEAGVDGVVVCGTVGESTALTGEERAEIISRARGLLDSSVGLVVGISGSTAAEASENARQASSLEADGLMCTPPISYAADEAELVAFFDEVAAATELPMMVYNNPFNTKTDMSAELMLRLFREIETIVAFKELSGDPRRIAELLEKADDGPAVLVGGDDYALEGLCAGAIGWVSGVANVAPAECVQLRSLCEQGELDDAQELYRKLLPMARLDMTPKLVQYFKAALERRGMPSGSCRPPRLDLSAAEVRSLEAAMRALELPDRSAS